MPAACGRRPALPRGGSCARGSSSNGAGPTFDPDAYELEAEDDDDYDQFISSAAYEGGGGAPAPERGAGAGAPLGSDAGEVRSASPWLIQQSSGCSRLVVPCQDMLLRLALRLGVPTPPAPLPSGLAPPPPPPRPTQAPRQQQQRSDTSLSDSLGMLLLTAAAVQRLLSRLQTAVVATMKVAWQLGREAFHGLRHSTVKAKVQAEHTFVNRWVGVGWQHGRGAGAPCVRTAAARLYTCIAALAAAVAMCNLCSCCVPPPLVLQPCRQEGAGLAEED